MRLPEERQRRHEFVIELGRQCSVSRSQRKAYHRELRSWYTRGTITEDRARYNKIKAHIRRSTSYLFQSASVRFGPVVPMRYGETFAEELDTVRDDFHRLWHGTKAGLITAMGVRWAHVYPTVVFKVVPSAGEPVLCLLPDPADFGVLEEDRPLDRQEAMVHFFWLTMPQVRRLVAGHPRQKELMALAQGGAELGTGDEPLTPAVERIALNTASPTMEGAIMTAPTLAIEAMIETPRILCAEVWVVDERINDWRVLTCLAPAGQVEEVVWDRRTPAMSGMDPFVTLTLDDTPDYQWGLSETDDLASLQDWREHKMDQIDRMLDLQLDPPIVLGGFGGLNDERAARLRKPGGTLSTSIPNPTVNRLAPTMPPEAFGEVKEIDNMFADQGGLSALLTGAPGETGLRGGGNQAGVLATLGSSRLLESASRVEYCVSEIATLMWRLHRELSDDALTTPTGKRFLLTQIPRDTEILVAAHSASPIYAASIKQEADQMLKAGAIDLPTYVELKDPPMADVLRAKARKLAEAKAKQAEKLLAIAEMKASRGRAR